jgi:UDP-glucose 4-epimerase
MKILVTGAAGQIGCGISRLLIEKGHEIVLVDNLRNGYVDNLKKDGKFIAPFHYIDISKPFALDYKFDAIIHLAAITSLPDCETHPMQTLQINVSGVANILEFAKINEVPHVIFTSTSAVYENCEEEVFTENLELTPKLYYSLSKKMAEELVESYRVNYGMNITTLRLFNVFGPDGDYRREHPPLLNYLVREFRAGVSPLLSSDGTQTRDFIWVGDVISMIEMCLEENANDTFNVCTGLNFSVNQIAQWVAEALDCTHIPLTYRPAQELWGSYPHLFAGKYPLNKNVVKHESTRPSVGSFEKAMELLGWRPHLNIEHLIKQVALQMPYDN